MAASEAEIAAFVRASGRDWKNYCQALVYQICARFGVARRVYSSATAAYLNSSIRSRNLRESVPGAVHYWEYWATIEGVHANYGHVGIDTRGGGVGVMSTGRPTQIGDGAAIIDFLTWTQGMGRAVKYLGWSLSNGQNAVTIVPSGSVAGGGGTPAEEDELDATQAGQLAKVAAFVERFEQTTSPWSGEPGVDLSTPRIKLAMDGSIHTAHRFVFRDESGTPTYDLSQLVRNEIKPMLQGLVDSIRQGGAGGSEPVDVNELAETFADVFVRRLAAQSNI